MDSNETNDLQDQLLELKQELDCAYQDMDTANREWLEAKEAQSEAFNDMRNRIIDHDGYLNYQKDTADKKDTFLQSKERFKELKTLFEERKRIISEQKTQSMREEGQL